MFQLFLFNILHISNADILVTQYNITTKRLYAINTVSVQDLSSTHNRLMYGYDEPVHPMYV